MSINAKKPVLINKPIIKQRISTYFAGKSLDDREITKAVDLIQKSFPHRSSIYYYEIYNFFKNQEDNDIYNNLVPLDLRRQFWREFLVDPKRSSGDKNTKQVIFIASTPRSGNTLLNKLLKELLKLDSYAIHKIEHMNYAKLSNNSIVQIHIDRNKFKPKNTVSENAKVITLVRHPFDVLLSAFRFSQKEPQCAYWLDGRVFKKPLMYKGIDPADLRFLKWAKSDGARQLLEVSRSWVGHADVVIRYEDIIENAEATVRKIHNSINSTTKLSKKDISEVAYEIQNNFLQNTDHRWSGVYENWKKYFTEPIARELYSYHEKYFNEYGYDISYEGLPNQEMVRNNCQQFWNR